MRKFKVLFASLFALCVLCAIVPWNVQAKYYEEDEWEEQIEDQWEENDTLSFRYQNDVMTISGQGNVTREWMDKQIEQLGFDLYDNEHFFRIVVSEGITGLGSGCFASMWPAESVRLPSTLEYIGKDCFGGCEGLTEIRIPNSVRYIGDAAFAYTGLESITLPEGLIQVGTLLFDHCGWLTEVNLPSDLKRIGDFWFHYCEALETVDLPEGLEVIGYAAFQHSGLNHIEIPDTVTTIEGSAFCEIDALEEIFIPDSVTSLGGHAFNWCGNLKKVRLPKGLKEIQGNTFEDCGALEEIEIPDTVECIGPYAFSGSGLTQIDIPDSVTTIDAYAFMYCGNLEEVIVPDSVTVLGDSAFRACGSLKKAKLSDNITELAWWTFQDCASLEEVELPANLELVWPFTFDCCESLVKIEIPEGTTTLGGNAFRYCESLEEIILPSTLETLGEQCFYGCESLEAVDLPQNLKNIHSYAFRHCYSLTEVILPESLIQLPDVEMVFANCKNLKNVTFPSHWDTVTEFIFAGCVGMTEFEIPSHITSIDNFAFWDCTGLEKLVIPSSVSYIDPEAFEGCDSLVIHGYSGSYAEEFANEKEIPFVTIHCDHAFGETEVLREPTESEEGEGRRTCSNCGITETVVLPPVEHMHRYTEAVTPATCTEGGFTTYTCECGDSYIGNETDALGHRYQRDSVAATCTGIGSVTDTCACCDSFLHEVIAPLGHDFGDWFIVSEAEENTWGEERRVCSNCSVSESRFLSPLTPVSGFEAVGDFSDGFAPVKLNGKWGYVNTAGQIVVQPQFDWANTVSDGYAVALKAIPNGHNFGHEIVYGYYAYLVSMDGTVTQLQMRYYHDIFDFDVPVIITTGVEPTGDGVFYEFWNMMLQEYPWLASDSFFNISSLWICNDSILRVANLSYDTAGNQIRFENPDNTFESDSWFFQRGPAVDGIIPMTAWVPYYSYTMAFYMDHQGNLIRDLSRYDDAFAPDAGLSVVAYREDYTMEEHRWGVINAEGEWVAQPVYQDFLFQTNGQIFQEDLLVVRTEDGLWGMIDRSGEMKISPSYSSISGFSCGYAAAAQNGLLFFLDHGENRYEILRPDGSPAQIKWGTKVNEAGLAAVYDSQTNEVYLADLNRAADGVVPTIQVDGLRYSSLVKTEENGQINGLDIPDTHVFIQEGDLWTILDLSQIQEPHTHNYIPVLVDGGTCTEGGFTEYACDCGDTYIADETAPLGHDYQSGICTWCGEADPDYREPVVNPFNDVPAGIWYEDPVLWAVENGITSGTSANTFSPDKACTRGQVVTFLWRAAGEPAAQSRNNPFVDVKEGAYYFEAVLWAVENGITSGTSANTFSPDKPCTRGQVVTFLHRAMGNPEPVQQDNPFGDVRNGDYFCRPVLWAVENGITSGVGPGRFAPGNPCTRAQVVTFLYRAMADK